MYKYIKNIAIIMALCLSLEAKDIQATISDGGEFDKNSNVIYMRYMHLDEIFFTPNDKNVEVKAGTLIGKSGVEGIKGGTRGPHLHFEISSCVPSLGLAYRVNPAFYIDYKTPESMIQNQPTQKDKIDFAHQTKVAKSVYLPKK
ncbi:hypothetical protein HRAG_01515 [Helicobacter bilis ATCC 43879]|uniref:M23ase beta-sheet core domain-containing protein n=2 Tax=Helicobacter TaxID=209 RepID=C3XHG9_9HELI|nr:M23 family metallopeptidase [Helicobacter bilis]EEO24458.2 hypothetical protein HRAG_01515 [Helicobacter bilis ATCC 43879]